MNIIQVVTSTLVAVVMIGATGRIIAAESAAAIKKAGDVLGAVGFMPTPDRPFGWRGDWTGRYPGATPPLQWSRKVTGITAGLRYQAKKPGGDPLKTSQPLEYFTIKDWLVAGPFSPTDSKQGIDQDFLGGEAAIQPNDGDKVGATTWKTVHVSMDNQTTHDCNIGMIDHLNVDFLYAFGTITRDPKTLISKFEGDLANKVGYAHTYIYAPTAGKVNLTELNWGAAAKAWLNGQPLPVVVPTPENQWAKKEIEVTLVQGWNRLLVKVASGDTPAKNWLGMVSCWRTATYLSPIAPVSYETSNVAWMTRVTGRSMSQPIVVGDKIFVGSAISDLMCFSKADGKVLWIRSNTPWDALSAQDRAAFKNAIEPLAAQLERMNDEVVTAINAMVSPQGMTSDQQEALDKRLKEKIDLEAKIHEAFKAADAKRFPPISGNEVSSSNAVPCSDGARVYWACGGGIKGPGASVICCFDLAGKRQWSYHEAFGAAEHGLHTSPLLVDGKLVYAAAATLIAFDAKTGNIAWRQPCEQVDGGSPQVVRIGSESAILVTPGQMWAKNLTLHRVSDGVKISECPCMCFGVDTPVVDNGVVYVPSRFTVYSDANVNFTGFQLPGSLAGNAAPTQLFQLDWLTTNVPLRGASYWVASPLFVDGMVYALDMSGGLIAVDVKAQKGAYHRWLDWYCRYSRFLYGAVASPTLGGKHVFLVDDAGCTIVLEPGPTYQEAGRNVLENISPSSCSGNPCHQEAFYSAPVFEGDTLFLKGEEYLYAIRAK